jgi:hypothetical protein
MRRSKREKISDRAVMKGGAAYRTETEAAPGPTISIALNDSRPWPAVAIPLFDGYGFRTKPTCVTTEVQDDARREKRAALVWMLSAEGLTPNPKT